MKINFVNLIAVLAGLCMSGGGVMIRYTLMNNLSDFKTSLVLSQSVFFIEVLIVTAFMYCRSHHNLTTPVGIMNIIAIVFLGAFLYCITLDANYKFCWYLVLSGICFGIGLISLYYVMSNMNIIASTVMTRSAGMICGLVLGALFLKDFPKSSVQYVGLGIIIVGIFIMTFFSSK